MRLRNFCIHIGFGLFVAIVLMVFVGSLPLAVLYVVFQLILAFICDRKTVSEERYQKALAEKYPARPMPDTQYTLGEQRVVLRDSYVKDALVETFSLTDHTSKKEEKAFLERFYSDVMAGAYTFEVYTATSKEKVSEDDSADAYYIHSDEKRLAIREAAFKACRIGDSLVGVTVRGMPTYSVLILLNPEGEQPMIAWQTPVYQLRMQARKKALRTPN